MKVHLVTIGVTALMSVCLLFAPAHAVELLFSDNFDIGTNSDINADLALRQSGTLSPSTYTDFDSAEGNGALPEIYANQLWLTAPNATGSPFTSRATVGLDANLTSTVGGKFTVDAFMSLDSIGGWGAVTIDSTQNSLLPGGNADISIVICPNTTYDLYVGGSKIIDENDANHGLFTGLDHDIHFAFDDVAGTFDLTIDGTAITTGQNYALSADRYLMLQSFSYGTSAPAAHVFDNIEVNLIESGGTIEPVVPEKLAHWTFYTDLTDSTGDNHGTGFGDPTIVTDARVGGGALQLDKDLQQYVTVNGLAGELSNYTPSTLMLWFKTERQGEDMAHNGDNIIFAANAADGSSNCYRAGTGVNGGIYWNPTNIDGATPDEEGGAGFNDGEWHFMALVIDEEGTTTAYCDADENGDLQEIAGFTDYADQPRWGLAGTFSFGQEWDGTTASNFYDGLIDDVQFWKGALPLEDIQAIYDAAPVVEKVAGDANNDGKVDGSDVTILAGNWQAGVGGVGGATWDMGDFNGDGAVDGSDVTILAGNWQYGVTTDAAFVPEPSMITMLLGAMLAGWFLRRK